MAQERPGALEHLKDQVSSALETFYEKIGKYHHAVSGQVVSGFHPPSDVTQEDRGIEITLEIPGMDAAALEVEAGDGWLAVRGHKKQERESRGGNYLLSERYFGTFERRFALPGDVDPDKARATFKDGVLTIHVPGRPGAKRVSKRIGIKAG
jgi:HSP20 family protein